MTVENLAELLHVLYCKKFHADDMTELLNREKEFCCWYLEDTIAPTWSQEDHKIWLEKAEYIGQLCLTNDFNLEDFYNDLIEINRIVFKYENKELLKWLTMKGE